ncbi:putative S-adenosyl-L-methionine-dependent methyltransferase [Kitasatospora phosalacinea]|uniref:S-adenosyl-L-methionine-dependent methyltransferase n=1 Tax=Kitasatospora phosalacinea TaxID=2065 RepID=A0A9W6UZ05_9ACTN|nr:SAM-dependent methyltransferase [Kitasatospora phosalacinea]GLW67758.1 putative S-adenosyl-L-methionine-dependent methyltransferase [Kitasatospora phosalacinea]
MTAPTDASRPDAGVGGGVGRTALLVAHARALEARRSGALAVDPFAEHFVRASPGCADWPDDPALVDPDDPLWGRLATYFALRTKVLDEHLLAAAGSGTRQVVLLGAGLDSRAHRLPWPPGTTVWELDRPGVLDFKQRVLDGLDAVPLARRRTVPVDLRGDWTSALTAAGLDPSRPVAWLAEGLFLYLPAADELAVATALDRLSVPGSTLAYEVKSAPESPAVRAAPVYAAARRRLGIDLLALFAPGPRPDTAAALTALGWSTTTRTPFDHSPTALRPEPRDALAANRWVTCLKRRPGDRSPAAPSGGDGREGVPGGGR